jgi:hypothetical protein
VKPKPKFKVGQVVRYGHNGYTAYFPVIKRKYDPNRCAKWDTGWWYDLDEYYHTTEHYLRALTKQEIG